MLFPRVRSEALAGALAPVGGCRDSTEKFREDLPGHKIQGDINLRSGRRGSGGSAGSSSKDAPSKAAVSNNRASVRPPTSRIFQSFVAGQDIQSKGKRNAYGFI